MPIIEGFRPLIRSRENMIFWGFIDCMQTHTLMLLSLGDRGW